MINGYIWNWTEITMRARRKCRLISLNFGNKPHFVDNVMIDLKDCDRLRDERKNRRSQFDKTVKLFQ